MISSPASPRVSTMVSPELVLLKTAVHRLSDPDTYALTRNHSQDPCRLHMYITMHQLAIFLIVTKPDNSHTFLTSRQTPTGTDNHGAQTDTKTQHGRTRKSHGKTNIQTQKHKNKPQKPKHMENTKTIKNKRAKSAYVLKWSKKIRPKRPKRTAKREE